MDVSCQGFLWKRGDKGVSLRDTFKRRFFRIEERATQIVYYKNQPPAGSTKGKKGAIDLTAVTSLQKADPAKYHGSGKVEAFAGFGLTIAVPGRNYYLVAESLDEFSEWAYALSQIVGRDKVDEHIMHVLKAGTDSDGSLSDGGPAPQRDSLSDSDVDGGAPSAAAGAGRVSRSSGSDDTPPPKEPAPRPTAQSGAWGSDDSGDGSFGGRTRRSSRARSAGRRGAAPSATRKKSAPQRGHRGEQNARAKMLASEVKRIEREKTEREEELRLAREVIAAGEQRVAELEDTVYTMSTGKTRSKKKKLEKPLLAGMDLEAVESDDEDDGSCQCACVVQ